MTSPMTSSATSSTTLCGSSPMILPTSPPIASLASSFGFSFAVVFVAASAVSVESVLW
eukprot:TRINITY_DN9766_c0_g1_i1.p2 TRINITY_DN9766_c0_g1~~TRINITY_DN9766_c0_g1_i1.p2  ORF type:complete len:58 (-),score=4.94 TRINITY_DN9766_c0_g1_i1:575-748(-)